MKRTPTPDLKLACIAVAFAGTLCAAVPAQSGPLAIANEPLGAPAGLILPNVMFILDDSGSMGDDYMPDYVVDLQNLPKNTSDTSFSTAACADSGDDDGLINGAPHQCQIGDPPFNSPDFNTIYYNPGITYLPGVNPPDTVSGISTDMASQNRAFTSAWTKVQKDPYLSPGTTVDLSAGYKDRVWCAAKTDPASICFLNTAYQYPDAVFMFGETTSAGTPKTRNGAPYYYRMQTAQYCTTAARDVCVSGSAIVPGDPATPGTHTFMAPEFCSDPELVNCVAGAAVVPNVHVFSGPRWCADPGTLVDCRRKKGTVQIGPGPTFKYYIYAKHLGTIKSVTGPFTARANSGSISVVSVDQVKGGTINDITIGNVSVITQKITFGAGLTTAQVADLIRTEINKSADFTTSPAGGAFVTISRKVAGATGAGEAITVSANAVGTKSSKGLLALSNAATAAAQEMTSLSVNGVNLLCPYVAALDDSSFGNGVVVRAGDGRIAATTGTNTNNKRNSFRSALISRVNTCAVGGFSVDPASTATQVLLVAPVSQGATPNGQAVARAGTGSLANFVVQGMGTAQPLPTSCAACQVGASTAGVVTSVIPMSGGQDALASGAARDVRIGVGAFSRTDIVSTVNAYAPPADSKRTDCITAGTAPNCTYDEEMTNFANWHAYYRTRMLMMKTAVGRAFVPVDTNFRVGFITICPVATACSNKTTSGLSIDLNKYLRVSDFTPSHKNAWYTVLYGTKPSGTTPLREALSRVGQIYAGVYGQGLTVGLKSTGDPATTDDPMTRSCQPNFALLSTDGYWNGGAGFREDGLTAVGNQDGKDAGPYSLQSQGVYDGGDKNSSDTLADVALYYYANDLRTSGPVSQNNVPTTTKDTASHQHMVTFTLGLGAEGELSFTDKYETATSGDFFDIKQGVKNWPVPVADSPSALDDLWHAAVNGRGVFYSVRDPVSLSKSLESLRNELDARLGAGAAAATSNLQPVAGDNFAFTASFTTSSWTGDLKARTIDLSTGVVSTVSLWSAAALLDNRAYTDRVIFTFDPTDLTANGGNLLKHFCPPGSCPGTDGAGLTPAEMSLFAASQLNQAFPVGPKKDNATNASLVNYLRGDRSFETSSPARPLDTDLYRSRDSLMGDIVNAQPSYVKRSPFTYLDAGFADSPSGFKQCTEGVGTSCGSLFPVPTRPRRGTVYAAANDGMLHAFETDTTDNPYFQTGGISTTTTADDTFTGDNTGNGVERWAYIPALLMPNLYKLANDAPFSHTYLADGTPQVGDIDICRSPTAGCAPGTTQWRTILVAGLNSGGIGYYALDITNPLAPKGLWEFGPGPCYTDAQIAAQDKTSDCNLGLSYGNAVITKLYNPGSPNPADRRWVVIVTSGYNNTFGAPPNKGDGRGYLYILDALTGKILYRLTDGAGTDTVDALAVPPKTGPSGLSKINGWTDDGASDNTARAIYGGDLEGNLWRFKLDSVDPVSHVLTPSVTKIAELKDSAGNRQPITVKPELALVGTGAKSSRVIAFGTGKFLELADKTPPELVPATVPPTILPFPKQTVYALKDPDPTDTSAGPLFSGGVRVTGVTELEFVDSADGSTRTINAVGLPPPAPACNPPSVVPPACSVSQNIPNLSDPAVLGWRIDLKENGERVNVDPVLQLGTLVIASNVPTTDSCSAGGFSFINFIDVTTGSFVKATLTSTMASVKISTSILVGVNVVMLPGGALKTIGTLADETRQSQDTPVPPKDFVGRRVSWRELFIDQ